MKPVIQRVAILLIGLLLTAGASNAQDPHFSQFMASPVALNPANAGLFNGCYRFTAVYRNQWSSILNTGDEKPFRTIAGSFDMRINSGFAKGDGFGLGLTVLSDKAGAASFGTNHAAVTFSYLKSLSREGNHYLSVGFTGGASQRSLDFFKLKFGNQFDGENYNPLLPSNEVLDADNFFFFTVSAGVMWSYSVTRGQNAKRKNFYAGASFHHLNRPNQSFYDVSEVKLYMRTNVNLGMQMPLTTQMDILPTVMYMNQGPANEFDVGFYLKYFFEPRNPLGNAIYFGPWYRFVGGDKDAGAGALNSEALILMLRLDYGGFTISGSYDLNFSDLTRATNSKGAFEVGLAYIIGCRDRKPQATYCPRF